jgi:hypothetical protein
MAIEQLVMVDRRRTKGDLVLQLKSVEPLRHKQFYNECRAAMETYCVQVWMTGVGDYSVAEWVTDDRDLVLNASYEVASRMVLGLETE